MLANITTTIGKAGGPYSEWQGYSEQSYIFKAYMSSILKDIVRSSDIELRCLSKVKGGYSVGSNISETSELNVGGYNLL